MKEMAIKKINRMGNVSLILANIAKVIIIIGMVATLIGAVVTSIIPDKFVTIHVNGDSNVELDFSKIDGLSEEQIQKALEEAVKNESVNIDIDGKGYAITDISSRGNKLFVNTGVKKERIITMHSIRNMCITAFVYEVFILLTLISVGSLSKAVRDCESPFEENVIKKLRLFSYALIPWVIADSAMLTSMNLFMSRSDGINLSVNMGMVMVVLVVYGLTYIFKYGAMLQQESDETL